jgi:archaellum component FlaF (FlaF/FlaG flagellin family)
MDVAMDFNVSSSTLALNLTMKGRVSFSGEVDDFVNVDIVETVDASKLAAANGASVSISLHGTISTSTQTYTYNHDTIVVTAGGEILHRS